MVGAGEGEGELMAAAVGEEACTVESKGEKVTHRWRETFCSL